MLTQEQIMRVAELARLELSAAEIESYGPQLSGILSYVEQLKNVNTDGVEPTCFIMPDYDPLRDDRIEPSLTREQLLSNGPSVKKDHFAVPKVISQ